jgi:hypothetical protein
MEQRMITGTQMPGITAKATLPPTQTQLHRRGWRWFWHQSPAYLQAGLALVSFVAGFFVYLPFATSTPPFKLLNVVLPEPAWGAIYMVCGLFQLFSVFRTRAYIKTVAALSGLMVWFYLSLLTFWYDHSALAWVVYGSFSFMWFLIMIRVIKVKE